MKEEENIVDEGECDLNSSIFDVSGSFVSELRLRSKKINRILGFFFLSIFV